jgi:shikimate dehydrogenase
MPHKMSTVDLLDECTPAVRVAGACNAVLRRPDGRLVGDMFDGVGFARGIARKGFVVEGARCLVIGAGGVGSAIAAALAAQGAAALALHDVDAAASQGLVDRLRDYYPDVTAAVAAPDPSGFDLVVNATPLGMRTEDPLPFDVARLSPRTFVGEVVLKQEMTPLLEAARARGCRYVVGTDMLFEQIPAYLEFFGFGTATPDALRAVAKVAY